MGSRKKHKFSSAFCVHSERTLPSLQGLKVVPQLKHACVIMDRGETFRVEMPVLRQRRLFDCRSFFL